MSFWHCCWIQIREESSYRGSSHKRNLQEWQTQHKGNGNGHQSVPFFRGHLKCSKSMFLCLLNSLVTRHFKKKPCTTPTNTSHMNVIAMGTKDSPLLSGQVTVSWAGTPHQIQRHKPVTGFAEFLLGEVCFLQGCDSETHWRRTRSTASNESYCYFCSLRVRYRRYKDEMPLCPWG